MTLPIDLISDSVGLTLVSTVELVFDYCMAHELWNYLDGQFLMIVILDHGLS